jgi:hypothetical protein
MVYTVHTVYTVCTVCTVHTVYTVRSKFIAKYAVYCEFIIKHAVCRSLLQTYCKTCGLPQFLKTIYDRRDCTVHCKPPQTATTSPKKKILMYYCHYCQKYRKSPSRFRFTLHNNINFNYSIMVNIIYINGVPLLHIINKGTRF